MKIPDSLRSLKTTLADRKKLRSHAGLQYALADSITMLDPAAWDALAKHGGFFFSRNYHAALEHVLPENISPRYALIYEGDAENRRPLAAVYMQIIDIHVSQTRPTKSKVTKLPTKLSENLKQRILTCGNLLSFGQHGVTYAPDADSKQLWHGVAEVLYRVRMAEKLAGKTHFVMIKDLHDPHIKPASYLKNLSYRYLETEPNMMLTLKPEWKSHDDYLAGLASKYRSNVKNAIFKPISEAGCRIERLTDVGSAQERIHELYVAVQRNADFRPFELPPEYFPALQRMGGDRLTCSVLKREDKILAFLITLADGDTAVAYHIGFDREAAETLPIYIRMLHVGIADALALGCKRLSFGRTALEPKAALGAKPEKFGILLRHRQPVLNKFMKRLLLGIEHEEAPERSPFKQGA